MENNEISTVNEEISDSSHLTRKYGLFTAIAMVVGCVVGSGVFFKAGSVLDKSGGSIGIGVLAWILGGLLMIVCAFAFATMAKRFEKVNGFTDYNEAMCGKKFGYIAGWFMATIYGPATMAIIPFVAAMYTAVLFGQGDNTGFIFALAAMYLALVYAMTVLAPKIAGYFQISTTIIKMIPILLIGIVGIFVGMKNGFQATDLVTVMDDPVVRNVSIYGAIFQTAFAYAGWDAVAAINSEIKNSRRNLPIALTFGSILIIIIYVLYFLGVAGGGNSDALIADGTAGTEAAVSSMFGSFASSLLLVFIVISCLGTTNGHTMATNRHMYSLATRGIGPFPKLFANVDPTTNTPTNGATLSLCLAFVWLFVHYMSTQPWMGDYYYIGIDDITVFGFSAICVPLFFMFMIKEKDVHWINRFVFPILACGASAFLVVALFIDNVTSALIYTAIILFVCAIGTLFLLSNSNRPEEQAVEEYPPI